MKSNPSIPKTLFRGFVFFFLLSACCPGAAGRAYHRVGRGDTLWSISREYGVSIEELREANEEIARSDIIRTGQLIFVPALLESSGRAATGVYHEVKRGDTLWDISKTYEVSVDDLRKMNGEISRTNLIRPGQRIFVPGAGTGLVVEPLTGQVREILGRGSSDRWNYIVIHHSATNVGSVRIFDRFHRVERGYRTMGYHFVIANGTDNTRDGQIQAGSRWPRQWDGAHISGDLNRVGIGICLVGNFETSVPSRRQMEALVKLTVHLAYRYDIPLENIGGHRQFADNTTRCPGRNFPWRDFRSALQARGVR